MLNPIDVHQRVSPILDLLHPLIEELESDLAKEPLSKDERRTILEELQQVDSILTGVYLTT